MLFLMKYCVMLCLVFSELYSIEVIELLNEVGLFWLKVVVVGMF